MSYAIEVAMQVANTDLSVLIFGESGVGKEVFSHVIHSLSARKHNPFIAVNCGAIPEGTIDSELFGHEKGSFTGAVDTRKGYFETVNGGTIFLDEIGELPLGTQARLLRVLETGEYIRVGSSKVQKTDVRVIAATNKDLLEYTHTGRFREDLYYRLNTVPIRVPPLRDRKEDIPLLFRKFAVDFAERYKSPPIQLDDQAQDVLKNYPWPGNVRQLKNLAEQLSVLAKERVITAGELESFLPAVPNYLPVIAQKQSGGNGHDFNSDREILYKLFFDVKKDVTELKRMFFEALQGNPEILESAGHLKDDRYYSDYAAEKTKGALGGHQPVVLESGELDEHEDIEESLSIMDAEKELIIKALKKHKGKRRDASSDLGISERTLYRKLKEYNISE